MTAQRCGLTSTEESEFLRRSCSVRVPVGIMETLHGKASAPSAGGREPVQLEPRDKTRGKATTDLNVMVSVQRRILFTAC